MLSNGKERSALQKVVLGIDAAWTTGNASGVSLLAFDGHIWQCLAIAPSYQQFLDYEDVDWNAEPPGGEPAIDLILDRANQITCGIRPDVIAVDMPLSNLPITARRTADNSISHEYGGRGCSVHSPSSTRPGQIADNLRRDCENTGYHLATNTSSPTQNALIEVYPHTAILKLLDLDYRHPYKVSNSSKYWDGRSVNERKTLLIDSFRKILGALATDIRGIDISLPETDEVLSLNHLKRFEDAIDALVCGWVAIKYLLEECDAYGDDSAAIWSP